MSKCEWFLKCENDAVTTIPGPNLLRIGALMEIPICQRCYDKVDSITKTLSD